MDGCTDGQDPACEREHIHLDYLFICVVKSTKKMKTFATAGQDWIELSETNIKRATYYLSGIYPKRLRTGCLVNRDQGSDHSVLRKPHRFQINL
jgi:hypothetical protein